MIKAIRDKLNLDLTDEQLKAKYIRDMKEVVQLLFPTGNNCHICFGKGYVSYNTETKQMIICDCVNKAAEKLIIAEEIKKAKKCLN